VKPYSFYPLAELLRVIREPLVSWSNVYGNMLREHYENVAKNENIILIQGNVSNKKIIG